MDLFSVVNKAGFASTGRYLSPQDQAKRGLHMERLLCILYPVSGAHLCIVQPSELTRDLQPCHKASFSHLVRQKCE
jgi:hypothetical protein